MNRFASLSLALTALAGAAACGSSDSTFGAPNLGSGFAVVNSDFTVSSISLLDNTGKLAAGDCFSSSTQAPGATLALSGDVVLPSAAQPGNDVVAIDRGNSSLTWLDPKTCKPLRQLDVSTGFKANPHDVIGVSATKAYVLRYELNPTPGKQANDAGDDILIIDPSKPAITGRIAMSTYAVQVTGTPIQARADRALVIDGTMYVALSNLSADFMTAGHGRLVMIDTATDKVTGQVDLPDLENCSGLSYLDDKHALYVSCQGLFSAADPAATSGVLTVDLSASPPKVTHTQPAAPFGGLTLESYSGVGRDGGLGFAVTAGAFKAPPTDALWTLDPSTGKATSVSSATESFVYGTVLVDAANQRVYLTDATSTKPQVLELTYTDTAAPTLATGVATSPAGLPPRELQRF
jgi:hypothetical protein